MPAFHWEATVPSAGIIRLISRRNTRPTWGLKDGEKEKRWDPFCFTALSSRPWLSVEPVHVDVLEKSEAYALLFHRGVAAYKRHTICTAIVASKHGRERLLVSRTVEHQRTKLWKREHFVAFISAGPNKIKGLSRLVTEAKDANQNKLKWDQSESFSTPYFPLHLCLVNDSYLESRTKVQLLFLHNLPRCNVWDLTGFIYLFFLYFSSNARGNAASIVWFN